VNNSLQKSQGTMLTSNRKVGFLRYWRSPNIPLFLFAAPMLAIMTVSSLSTIFTKPFLDVSLQPTLAVAGFEWQEFSGVKRTRRLLRTLALPQLLLALLALTSYHVQIITRISSGYPVWYFWLASHIVEANGSLARSHSKDYRRQAESSAAMVRYVIVYAVVQGGLFASFLPPA
jgi:phosphatidylinositol glycan class V